MGNVAAPEEDYCRGRSFRNLKFPSCSFLVKLSGETKPQSDDGTTEMQHEIFSMFPTGFIWKELKQCLLLLSVLCPTLIRNFHPPFFSPWSSLKRFIVHFATFPLCWWVNGFCGISFLSRAHVAVSYPGCLGGFSKEGGRGNFLAWKALSWPWVFGCSARSRSWQKHLLWKWGPLLAASKLATSRLSTAPVLLDKRWVLRWVFHLRRAG